MAMIAKGWLGGSVLQHGAVVDDDEAAEGPGQWLNASPHPILGHMIVFRLWQWPMSFNQRIPE